MPAHICRLIRLGELLASPLPAGNESVRPDETIRSQPVHYALGTTAEYEYLGARDMWDCDDGDLCHAYKGSVAYQRSLSVAIVNLSCLSIKWTTCKQVASTCS